MFGEEFFAESNLLPVKSFYKWIDIYKTMHDFQEF